MAPKTEFSIPLQMTGGVGTHSRRSTREVRTTEVVSLQHPSKRASLPSGSQRKVEGTARAAEDHPSGQPSQDIIEAYPLHMTDIQEGAEDIESRDADDKQSNVKIILPHVDQTDSFTDTNGPMASLASKISPSIAGDGGTQQGSQVFHLHQCHGGQMHRLHGWKLLLQSLLHSLTQANTISSAGPMDWWALCANILVHTWLCVVSWASWRTMPTYSRGMISSILLVLKIISYI